jgi:hypothetical protein
MISQMEGTDMELALCFLAAFFAGTTLALAWLPAFGRLSDRLKARKARRLTDEDQEEFERYVIERIKESNERKD